MAGGAAGGAAAPPRPGQYAGLLAALSYSAISIAITLFNKAVLSSYAFHSSMTLTLLQGLVTVVCLEFMRWKKWIDFPKFDWAVARKVFPLSFVFIAYVVISLVSLGRVNVPMFTALRRITIVFVMMEEWYLLGILPSWGVVQTVIVMCVGAAIAAWKDLSFEPVSYFYLFLTNLFTSLYTVYINVVKKETGLNIWAMMWYNNVTTMPVLLLIALYTGDLQEAWAYKGWRDIFFQFNFQASVFLAFFLNVSTFYCTTLNTARTQTVVGQLKNFVAFLLGLVLFDDYIYEATNFFGLMVGFLGGVLYSYVTYAERVSAGAAAKKGAALSAGAALLPAGSGGGSGSGSGGGGGDGGLGAAESGLRSPKRGPAYERLPAGGDLGGGAGAMPGGPGDVFVLPDRGLLRATDGTGPPAGGELRARTGGL